MIAGLLDGDVFGVSAGAFADMFCPIPDYLADVDGIFEDEGHRRPVKGIAAAGLCAQRVDVAGNGNAAISIGVHLKHHTHVSGLALHDLQGRLAVYRYLAIPIGGICHVAAVPDGLGLSALEPLIDDLVLPAGHEGLKFGQLVVDLIGEIIGFFRRDNQRPGVLKCVQNDALVFHAATGETIQVHTQDGVIFAVLPRLPADGASPAGHRGFRR